MGLHTIYLVRHGQYDEQDDGSLTSLGRKQAALAGKALRAHRISQIWTSTLRRAIETTEIVHESFPNVPVKSTKLLCEAIPTRIPRIPKFAPAARIQQDRLRADRAFEQVFRPVKKSRSTLVVAHGNIIRYFMCKALGIAPTTWVKLGSTHCSITEIVIEPSGYMRLRSFNETQHLPKDMRTMSLAVMKQD